MGLYSNLKNIANNIFYSNKYTFFKYFISKNKDSGTNKKYDSLKDDGLTNPGIVILFNIFNRYVQDVEFRINKEGKKLSLDDSGLSSDERSILTLLQNPNMHQTGSQFLCSLVTNYLFYGCAYLYSILGNNTKTELFILENKNLTFTKLEQYILESDNSIRLTKKNLSNIEIDYTSISKKYKILYKDLIFFIETPADFPYNTIKGVSRLKGLSNTLNNVEDAIISKNTTLLRNKEFFVTRKQDNKYEPATDINPKRNNNAFILNNKKKNDSLIIEALKIEKSVEKKGFTYSNIPLDVSSLSVNLRQLGYDESIISDISLLLCAYGVPKDLLELKAEGSKSDKQTEPEETFVNSEVKGIIKVICRQLEKYFNLSYNSLSFEIKDSYYLERLKEKKALNVYKFTQSLEKLSIFARNTKETSNKDINIGDASKKIIDKIIKEL